MEQRGIQEAGPSDLDLGRIPEPPPAGTQPQSQTKPSAQQNKQTSIADIRKKLLRGVLEDTVVIQDISYTLQSIDRLKLRNLQIEIEKELDFERIKGYNPDDLLLSQLDKLNGADMLVVAVKFLKHAIKKIDGVLCEDVFSEMDITLEGFLNLSTTPIDELITNYIELSTRDIVSESEIKNS